MCIQIVLVKRYFTAFNRSAVFLGSAGQEKILTYCLCELFLSHLGNARSVFHDFRVDAQKIAMQSEKENILVLYLLDIVLAAL